MSIHPTAIIDSQAEIDATVEIGPHTVVEGSVTIGAGTKIGPGVHILGWTTIGRDCRIHHGATIGDLPQDFHYAGERSYVRIGDRAVLREGCTIHRGTQPESATVLHDDVSLQTCAHVGHNCILHERTSVYSGAVLAGHVEMHRGAIVSGAGGAHQFVRIGELALVGGTYVAIMDLPPFVLASGHGKVAGVNIVGMRRAGYEREAIDEVRAIHRRLYRSGEPFREALAALAAEVRTEAGRKFVNFCRNPSRRGIAGPLERPRGRRSREDD